jgi:hypothetical protein
VWLPALLNPLRNRLWTQFLFHKLLRFLTPYCAVVIGAWCLAKAGPMVTRSWSPWQNAAAIALVCVAAAMADRAKQLRNLIVHALLLLAAVMVATFNGLRGRWDVWGR